MKTDSHHFEITEKCLLWHFMFKILFEFLPLFIGSDYGQVTYFYPLFIGSDMRQITFFYPFLLGQIWVKLHFLPPFYWVNFKSNYIFYPFVLGQIRTIYIFLQFLLEQIMDKLHILPLFIGSFCDFHTLWHCVKCSFNTLKKRLIFHTLDYWCLMDKLGLRSWPKYFEQKIRFLHRMEFYLQQRI